MKNMKIHLDYYGTRAYCGIDAPRQQVVMQRSIHLVTCLECLRKRIERLEDDVDEAWRQAAGESI